MMQIGTLQLFQTARRQMTDLSSEAAKLNTQIATKVRIQAPSDDAVAFGRVTAVKRSMANETQYADNVTMAQTLLTQSDSALESMETQIARVKELALRASNDIMSVADRKAIATELDGVLDAMVNIANQTDARGQALFGGSEGGVPFARNAEGDIVFQSTGDPPAIPISDSARIAANDSGARLFGNVAGGQDMFAIVKGLGDALASTTATTDELRSAIDSSIGGLDASVERLANSRSSVGARAARLDLEAEQYKALATQREDERSGLEDTNIEEAIVKLQQSTLVLQATQASFTKLSQLSLFDYIR